MKAAYYSIIITSTKGYFVVFDIPSLLLDGTLKNASRMSGMVKDTDNSGDNSFYTTVDPLRNHKLQAAMMGS